ncbi:hypothetical protein HPB51_016380 [Rhipicephalus microplus]|uniref:Uncharacterized protein n=1 Tax=Rhipicephalus microplus TaxID=6941 RepID=A0A9J6DHM0_RHIMP|nr:hypothetical protein HPB51_016380 [Rhipicephalus microplus]
MALGHLSTHRATKLALGPSVRFMSAAAQLTADHLDDIHYSEQAADQGRPGKRPPVPSQDGVTAHAEAALGTVRHGPVVPPMRGHGRNHPTYPDGLPATRSEGPTQDNLAEYLGLPDDPVDTRVEHTESAKRRLKLWDRLCWQVDKHPDSVQRNEGPTEISKRRRRHWIDLAEGTFPLVAKRAIYYQTFLSSNSKVENV